MIVHHNEDSHFFNFPSAISISRKRILQICHDVLIYREYRHLLLSFSFIMYTPHDKEYDFSVLQYNTLHRCGVLPHFGLSFNPTIPSLLYLSSQYEAQGLLLWSCCTT